MTGLGQHRLDEDRCEPVHANMPPLGLAAATSAVSVARGRSAAQRLGERDDDAQPVEGY